MTRSAPDSSSSVPPERLVNGPVFVEFRWLGDRYGHVVGLISSGEPVAILRSDEGDSFQDWPPSPPLQQLSIEPNDDGAPRAFLVGMAGQSHWSLVVEPIPGGFVFDAAVRCKSVPEFRGSCYERLAPSAELFVASDRLGFDPRESMAPLDHPFAGPTPLAHEAAQGTEPRFVIGPPDHVGVLPATFQWRYRITTTREALA